jgi:hypothetical protein
MIESAADQRNKHPTFSHRFTPIFTDSEMPTSGQSDLCFICVNQWQQIFLIASPVAASKRAPQRGIGCQPMFPDFGVGR